VFYSHHPAHVQLRQTHFSYVLLAGDYVYKINKNRPFYLSLLLDARQAASFLPGGGTPKLAPGTRGLPEGRSHHAARRRLCTGGRGTRTEQVDSFYPLDTAN
jgi:hypothetical protein